MVSLDYASLKGNVRGSYCLAYYRMGGDLVDNLVSAIWRWRYGMRDKIAENQCFTHEIISKSFDIGLKVVIFANHLNRV